MLCLTPLLFHFFAATCQDSTFTLLSNACYKAVLKDPLPHYTYDYLGARIQCLYPSRQGASSVLAAIKSQEDQNNVEKAIAYSTARQALKVYSGLRVQKKTFLNGTVKWLDENNDVLPYTNFADNQNPVGTTCVLLSRKHKYKWLTVNCKSRSARAVVCKASQGE